MHHPDQCSFPYRPAGKIVQFSVVKAAACARIGRSNLIGAKSISLDAGIDVGASKVSAGPFMKSAG